MRELKRISAKTAYDVAQHYRVGDDAVLLLAPAMTPDEYLCALEAKQLMAEAVRFLAHALPRRLAVWWLCRVAERVTETNPQSAHYQAFLAAERWVKNPTEENRRLAERAGAKTQFSSAASWAAMAAFWSTGSLASADLPMVAPPAFLYAHAVYGGIGVAAVTPTPDLYEDNMRRYYQLGIELACGGNGIMVRSEDEAVDPVMG
ncbi:MAG TPA: hypothetical protein VFM46_12880 [Pseudomonadales bacterium]|nr:hypothetical protein [Pseudomonadales bacterium]